MLSSFYFKIWAFSFSSFLLKTLLLTQSFKNNLWHQIKIPMLTKPVSFDYSDVTPWEARGVVKQCRCVSHAHPHTHIHIPYDLLLWCFRVDLMENGQGRETLAGVAPGSGRSAPAALCYVESIHWPLVGWGEHPMLSCPSLPLYPGSRSKHSAHSLLPC